MGAWDATSFGNDKANDWAYGLDGSSDLSYIEAALQNILDQGDEYIETPDSEEGIAAAEVVAWLLGRPSPVNAFTQKIADWVAAHPIKPPQSTTDKALAVLTRIQREPSELKDLWEHDPDWIAAISDLQQRLSGEGR